MAQVWATVTAYETKDPKFNSTSGNSRITRLSTGVYLIDFADGTFKNTPALVVTQQFSDNAKWTDFSSNGGNTKDNAVIVALTKSQAKIKTGDEGGGTRDRNFSYVAIGD